MLGRRKHASTLGSVDIIDRVRERAHYSLSSSARPEAAAPPTEQRDSLDWRLVYQVLEEVSARLDQALGDGEEPLSPTRVAVLLDQALREQEVSLTSRARSALLGRVLRELCGPGSRVAACNAAGFKGAKGSLAVQPSPDAPFSLEQDPRLGPMIDQGRLSPAMARFLEQAVLCRLNVLISGQDGIGRRTLLGAIARNIDVRERMATVEAGRPIVLDQLRVKRLKAETVGGDGGEVRSRMPELLWRALASKPTYLLVGKIPDSEQNRRVAGLLQAVEQGQDGILVIADQEDVPFLVERLAARNPSKVGAAGFDLVVHLERRPGDIARVSRISEIVVDADGRAQLVDLFRQIRTKDPEGDAARTGFLATGARPRFLARAERSGCGLTILEALAPAAEPWSVGM